MNPSNAPAVLDATKAAWSMTKPPWEPKPTRSKSKLSLRPKLYAAAVSEDCSTTIPEPMVVDTVMRFT